MISQKDITKRLWNPVVDISNAIQCHDVDSTEACINLLKQLHGGAELKARIPRSNYDMQHEHAVFDRAPEMYREVTITVGQLLDAYLGAYKTLRFVTEQGQGDVYV